MNEAEGSAQSMVPLRDASNLPSAKALADAALIDQDLQFVVACCDRVLADEAAERSDALVERALWRAAIVAYVRCFSTGQRGSLGVEDVQGLPLEGAGEFHEHIRQMRNKHVAHSENAFEQAAVGVLPTADGSSVEAVGFLTMDLLRFQSDTVADLGTLARELLRARADRVEDLSRQVLEEAQRQDGAVFLARPTMRLYAGSPSDVRRKRRWEAKEGGEAASGT